MKKTILTCSIILFTCATVYSKTITITVRNFQFVPQSIPDVLVGDVLVWDWSNGGHTTTSLIVPFGAAAWDAPIDVNNTSYQYTALVTGNYSYECSIHAAFMVGSFTVSAPVPVVLSEFKVNSNGGQSNLLWKTSSEYNADFFMVKRSLDGTDFKELGRVNATGFSNVEKTYSFTDYKLPLGNKYLYYLVEIIDKDGKIQNSPIRLTVNYKAQARIITSLTPNPVSKPGHLMLKFNADEEGVMEAILLDMQGRPLLSTSLEAVKGVNNGHIHLGDIPPGTYNIIFILKSVKEVHRIIVK
ncbi:hypothetical protein BH11BAC3_BH11BAC3_33910 [soil metagenome]